MKFLNGKHLQGHALLPAFYQGQKSAPVSLAGDHPAPVRIFSVKSILGLVYGPDCPSCTPSDPTFCQDRAEQSKVICTMLSARLLFWEQVMAFQSLNPMDGHATSLIGNVLEHMELSSKLAGAHLLSVYFQISLLLWDTYLRSRFKKK